MDAQVNDPLAGGIIISMTGSSLAATMAYYNGEGPLSNAFEEILAIPPEVDNISQNIAQQQLNALVDDVYPPGRQTIFLAFKADVQSALDLNQKTNELFAPFEGRNISFAVTLQPSQRLVTRIINWGTAQSKARGLFAPWIYLNYALPDQQVYQSFGEANFNKLEALKKQWDPKNFFGQLWPGGFKL